MEIEANLQPAEETKTQITGKPQTTQEMHSAVEDLSTPYGGKGGNISEMKYIRLKIKTLTVEDAELLTQMIEKVHGKGFALIVTLPLADVYQKTISHQTIKLTNYSYTAQNEFEFSSMSLYNFRINEETFGDLSGSELKIQIDESGPSGTLKMGKLLLAPNF